MSLILRSPYPEAVTPPAAVSRRTAPTRAVARKPVGPFVTRSGAGLYVGGVRFDPFVSVNFMWLGLSHSATWQPTPPGGTYYPSRKQVDDGYATAVAMGCQVVRGYSLGPTFGYTNSVFPTSTEALAATPSEAAMVVADYAVARARDYGLRLIPVLSDREGYDYYVGSPIKWSTALGGAGTNADFYALSTTTTRWKSCVQAFVTRRNTLTGLRYCDDPTIMAWETGNEIGNRGAWARSLATYLKSIAPRQLVLDGAFPAADGWDATSLAYSDLDLHSDHYYPLSTTQLATDISTCAAATKPFIAGEWDWNNNRGGTALATFLAAMVTGRSQMAGSGWWALAAHADTYGWENANNYVGQDSLPYDLLFGNATNQSKVLALRQWAHDFRGRTAPAWLVPGVTTLSLSSGTLRWRGAAGAASYTVERSAAGLAYTTETAGVLDSQVPYTPLSTGYYRVRGVTPDGTSGQPSNVVSV